MAKNHIKIIGVAVIMILVLLLNSFKLEILTVDNIYTMLFLLITIIALKFMVGFEKDKHMFKVDFLQITFIYIIVYFLFTYICGLFFGFTRNPFSMEFIRILGNVIPLIIVVILKEVSRYMLVAKANGSKLIFALTVIVFAAFDILLNISAYPLGDALGIFEAIGILILPSLARSFLLTFMAMKAGYKPAIVYELIFGIAMFVIPIYPDLGLYIRSIIEIVFPVILFLKLNSFIALTKPTAISFIRKTRIKRFLVWIPSVSLLVIIVILVSGLFRVYAMAIGSGSMSPQINKGDVILIEKLNEAEIRNLEIGNVIAFEHDRKIVIHRIIDIREQGEQFIYSTQGDANNTPDDYDVLEEDLRGLVRLRIPFIGFPTVWLSELFN